MYPLEALLVATGAVALAELGDKTQFLALLLVIRFGRPWTIFFAIFAAASLNHGLSAWVGQFFATRLDTELIQVITGFSFIAIGLWMLRPDETPEEARALRAGVFFTAFVLFSLAELGDKTQLATVLLGARYGEVALVTMGSTLGMLLANAPALWIGERFAKRLPVRGLHVASCALFILIGLFTLFAAWR